MHGPKMHTHTQRRLVEILFSTRRSHEFESMMRVDAVDARAISTCPGEGANIMFACKKISLD